MEEKRVVGSIHPSTPDFEFANFDLPELVEVAACIDEAKGVSGDSVRRADWSGVSNGDEFETGYRAVSRRRPRSLKGRTWGEALGSYAGEHPTRSATDQERPYVAAVLTALRSRIAAYDFQKARRGFDPKTFAPIDIEPDVDSAWNNSR